MRVRVRNLAFVRQKIKVAGQSKRGIAPSTFSRRTNDEAIEKALQEIRNALTRN